MKLTRTATVLAMALGLLATAAAAAAFEGFPPGKWWKNPRLAADLRLTPEQVSRFEALFLEERKRLIDLKAEAEKRELDLEALLRAEPLDPQALEAQIDRVNEARAQLNKARLLMQVKVWQALTPEQRQQIRAWRAAEEREHPRGRPGGPPGRAVGPPERRGGPPGPPPGLRPGPPHGALLLEQIAEPVAAR